MSTPAHLALHKKEIHIEFYFLLASLALVFPMNLRKFFNAFRLEVQLRENEITMGKAFVSYFLSLAPQTAPPPHLSVDIFISQLFQRTRQQQLYFHFLLCFRNLSVQQAASAKASERIGLWGCLQWRIEFQSEPSNSSIACTFRLRPASFEIAQAGASAKRNKRN